MCLPTAYGWPMYRSLSKDIKYTGLVSVHAKGDYEVTVEISPPESRAHLILEVDGTPLRHGLKANQVKTVPLEAGIRALSVSTPEGGPLHFAKFHVNRKPKKYTPPLLKL